MSVHTGVESYRDELAQHAEECGIPGYMIEGIVAYIADRRPPGGFLRRVLENDLMGALGKADSTNINCLRGYGMFLYNYAPITCRGSPRKVAAWLGELVTDERSNENA